MEKTDFSPLDEALLESRIVLVDGQVDSKMAHRVNKTLLAMEKKDPKKPVVLHINSPGGEVNSGFSIFDTARFISPKVYTLVTGLAASMGSVIALTADKRSRFAFPNSKFLIHQPLIPGGIFGQASDLEIHAKDILKTRERINRLYAEETGHTIEEIAKLTERDHWLDAKEALELGLISKIIQNREELPT